MIELRECPFCGKKVKLEVESYGYGTDYHEHCIVIRCDSCDFEFPKKPIQIRAIWDEVSREYISDMSEFDEAVEKWNKRADS